MEDIRWPLKKSNQPCTLRIWTNEWSTSHLLFVKVCLLKGNSWRNMVVLRRRKVKSYTILMVVMLQQLGVIIVIRRVTQERCALIDWIIMVERIMIMQPLCKIIMNHLMSWWFQEVTLATSGLWIQGALDTWLQTKTCLGNFMIKMVDQCCWETTKLAKLQVFNMWDSSSMVSQQGYWLILDMHLILREIWYLLINSTRKNMFSKVRKVS